jgi:hypothetical protein
VKLARPMKRKKRLARRRKRIDWEALLQKNVMLSLSKHLYCSSN